MLVSTQSSSGENSPAWPKERRGDSRPREVSDGLAELHAMGRLFLCLPPANFHLPSPRQGMKGLTRHMCPLPCLLHPGAKLGSMSICQGLNKRIRGAGGDI